MATLRWNTRKKLAITTFALFWPITQKKRWKLKKVGKVVVREENQEEGGEAAFVEIDVEGNDRKRMWPPKSLYSFLTWEGPPPKNSLGVLALRPGTSHGPPLPHISRTTGSAGGSRATTSHSHSHGYDPNRTESPLLGFKQDKDRKQKRKWALGGGVDNGGMALDGMLLRTPSSPVPHSLEERLNMAVRMELESVDSPSTPGSSSLRSPMPSRPSSRGNPLLLNARSAPRPDSPSSMTGGTRIKNSPLVAKVRRESLLGASGRMS
eukprot:Rmarinus@m.20361